MAPLRLATLLRAGIFLFQIAAGLSFIVPGKSIPVRSRAGEGFAGDATQVIDQARGGRSTAPSSTQTMDATMRLGVSRLGQQQSRRSCCFRAGESNVRKRVQGRRR